MNTRFKLFLINYLGQRKVNRHSGFALPMAIMTGLVIMLVGTTLMIRAQGDQTKVVSQKAKASSMAAAETGLTRVQNFITQNPYLAQYSLVDWQNAVNAPTSATAVSMMTNVVNNSKQQSCTYKSQADSAVKTAILAQMAAMTAAAASSQSLPNPDSSNSALAPYYQVKNYYFYPDGTAKVHVQGKAGADSRSLSNIVTTVPVSSGISTNPTSAFPGLWVKTSLNAGKVDANVAYDCGVNPSKIVATLGTGFTMEATNIPMPDAPTTPTTNIIALTFANTGTQANAIPLQSGTRTLPRTADITSGANRNSAGEYQYTLDTITDNLNITPGYKVTIYLNGNINLQGGKKALKHQCAGVTGCDATDAKIIGKSASGTLHLGGNPSICDIFFWAPTYNLDQNGGGQAQGCGGGPNNNGIYWLNSFTGGGQGNHIAMSQSGSNWNNMMSAVTFPSKNKIGSSSQWATVDEIYTVTAPTSAEQIQIAAIRGTTNVTQVASQNITTCTVPNLVGTSTASKTAATLLTAVQSALVNFTGTPIGTSNPNGASNTILEQSVPANSVVPCTTAIGYTYKLATDTPVCAVTVPASAGLTKNSGGTISVTYANASNLTISASGSGKVSSVSPTSRIVTGSGTTSFAVLVSNGSGTASVAFSSSCGSGTASSSF